MRKTLCRFPKKISLVMLIIIGLTGCGRAPSGVVTDIEPGISRKLERHSIDDNYSILVDKKTGVCYLEYCCKLNSNHAAYGITVMLNADGTPVKWNDVR